MDHGARPDPESTPVTVVPILEISGVLVVSIQVELSDTAVELLQQRLLERVTATRGRSLVIDISAMEIVDSYFCRILRDTAKMAQLMGATTVVSGIRPAVAITLTELGLELHGVETAMSLDSALTLLTERHADA